MDPSVHPFGSAYPGSDHSQHPSPSNVIQFFLEDPNMFQYVIYSPSSEFWIYSKVSSQLDILGIPPKEGAHPYQTTPPQLVQQLHPGSLWTSKLFILTLLPLSDKCDNCALKSIIFNGLTVQADNQVKLWVCTANGIASEGRLEATYRGNCSYSQSHSFQHYQNLKAIGESWND